MNDVSPPEAVEEALPARRSNRPVTPFHWLEYGLTSALFGVFRLIGVDRASALAGGFMRFVGPKLRGLSRRAENNLRRAFPEWSKEQVKETTAEVWENLGRTAAEYAHLDEFHIDGDDPRVTYESDPESEALLRARRQVIFAAGHFANWEMPAIVASELGIDFALVYRPANNPLVDEMIIKKRGRAMNRRMIPKGGRGALALVDTLKKGISLALLVDQKLNTGIAVPFFGRNAMTAPSPARFALKHDLPVILITVRRTDGARFRVTAHAPIMPERTGDADADIRLLTRKINAELESAIRACPGQWLWLHRRWPKKA